jgi:hypothetical protein
LLQEGGLGRVEERVDERPGAQELKVGGQVDNTVGLNVEGERIRPARGGVVVGADALISTRRPHQAVLEEPSNRRASLKQVEESQPPEETREVGQGKAMGAPRSRAPLARFLVCLQVWLGFFSLAILFALSVMTWQ